MLLDGLLIALLIGLLAGGRLSRLAALDLRRPWWFIGAFAVQFPIKLLGAAGWRPMIVAAPVLHLLSYALLLAAVAANRRHWPLWIAMLGIAMNLTVIAANGGAMPAKAELVAAAGQNKILAYARAGRFPTHELVDAKTRLVFLADSYLLPPLPTHFPRSCVFSPGDVALTIGAVLLLLQGMGAFGWGVARARPAATASST